MKIRQAFTDRRGNILIFTVAGALVIMLVFAGLATDMAYYGDIDTELQRAMDAAALAGAGNLGFDSNKFGNVRTAAALYASLNKFRGATGTITLDPNDGTGGSLTPNDPDLDNAVVLGIWDPAARTFTPSLEGNLVNAVRTQYRADIDTTFLKVAGIPKLRARARATAWAPTPNLPVECPLPIALAWDGSFPSSDPAGNSLCGKPAFFISSSQSSSVGFNTAGWTNLSATGCPNATGATIPSQITSAANGTCTPPAVKKGDSVSINGGMVQNAFDAVVSGFQTHFAASGTEEVTANDPNGNPITVYNGKGWKVTVPVVDKSTQGTTCTVAWTPFRGTVLAWAWEHLLPCVGRADAQPQNNQNMQVMGWTQFVMTMVIDRGDCVVDNPADTTNSAQWPGPPHCSNGGAAENNALRGIYGFYKCEIFDTPGGPGVVAALAKPRLVQ